MVQHVRRARDNCNQKFELIVAACFKKSNERTFGVALKITIKIRGGQMAGYDPNASNNGFFPQMDPHPVRSSDSAVPIHGANIILRKLRSLVKINQLLERYPEFPFFAQTDGKKDLRPNAMPHTWVMASWL